MAKLQKSCSALDCNGDVYAKELCRKHYKRLWRHGDIAGGRIEQGEARTFLESVVLLYSGDDCLTWPYGRDSSGYARIWDQGKAENVCRVVCSRIYGEPTADANYSTHSCGKGHLGCVSPLHLQWATAKENTADRAVHGTMPKKRNPS